MAEDRIGSAMNERAEVPDRPPAPPSVPADGASADARAMYDWLGSFWSSVYEDPDFVRYVQGARALRTAQLYLDVLEAAALVDRAGAPVFHRERWRPIVVRRSERNSGSSTMLRLGSREGAVVGPQTAEHYEPGTVFTLGGRDASFKGVSVYPLDPSVKSVATCIVDDIARPRTIMHSGTDYAVLDGAIAVRSDMDPFADGSTFPTFEVVADDPADNDEEAVMWACDSLVDKDYVYGHLGYAMGLPGKSSEGYRRIVNAVWSTVSEGASPRLLQALVAAMCGVPTVRNETETVETILALDDGGYQVITDSEVYTLPKYSRLHPSVHAGVTLRRFDLVDDSIRVYPYVMDVDRLSGYTEFADKFESDVPAMDLPPALFRTSLDDGFSVGWGRRDIVCRGFDANGNPKLCFRLDGSDEDNEAFWNDVWSAYEETGESIERCFGDDIRDRDYRPGGTCGSIVPIRFFLRQLVGANTLVVTVRTDVVGDDSPLYDPKFFRTIRECVPSYVRLFFIEHESVGYGTGQDPAEDSMDASGAEDSADRSVYDEEFDDADLGGVRGFRARDRLSSAKWVAKCRDKDYYDEID